VKNAELSNAGLEPKIPDSSQKCCAYAKNCQLMPNTTKLTSKAPGLCLKCKAQQPCRILNTN